LFEKPVRFVDILDSNALGIEEDEGMKVELARVLPFSQNHENRDDEIMMHDFGNLNELFLLSSWRKV